MRPGTGTGGCQAKSESSSSESPVSSSSSGGETISAIASSGLAGLDSLARVGQFGPANLVCLTAIRHAVQSPFRIVNDVEMAAVGVVFHALIGNFVRPLVVAFDIPEELLCLTFTVRDLIVS
jgi:hypothetical protein